MDIINSVGRRKTSVARVYLTKGIGKISINNKELYDYFPEDLFRINVQQPFLLLECDKDYDIKINVVGGGNRGQSEAIRLGISRALCLQNADYKRILKSAGFLTRDSRSVESKKYGQKKSRKRFQFSKR